MSDWEERMSTTTWSSINRTFLLPFFISQIYRNTLTNTAEEYRSKKTRRQKTVTPNHSCTFNKDLFSDDDKHGERRIHHLFQALECRAFPCHGSIYCGYNVLISLIHPKAILAWVPDAPFLFRKNYKTLAGASTLSSCIHHHYRHFIQKESYVYGHVLRNSPAFEISRSRCSRCRPTIRVLSSSDTHLQSLTSRSFESLIHAALALVG